MYRREARERDPKLASDLTDERLALGIALERALESELVLERLVTANPLAAGEIPAGVDDQAVQPGRELGLASKLVDTLAELRERVLRCVLRILGIAELPPGNSLDTRRMTSAERFEGFFVAVFCTPDQDGIAELLVGKSSVGPKRTTYSTALAQTRFHRRFSLVIVSESLAPTRLRPLLRGHFGRALYLHAERCRSTQELLPEDAAEGALAVAEEQLSGRGRLGRDWIAPPGSSVLFSLCLRPSVETAKLASLTPRAGEAVAEAISAIGGLQATVKHPNDVLVAGKKVAGILAEASEGRVALGVGINVNQDAGDLPERPVYPASSLRLELGRELDRAELLVEVLERLERHYRRWLEEAASAD